MVLIAGVQIGLLGNPVLERINFKCTAAFFTGNPVYKKNLYEWAQS